MRTPGLVPDSVANPPEDLSEASQGLWQGLATDLVVLGAATEAALLVLADALRLAERADTVARAVAEDGATTNGSTGQLRVHPAIVEERVLRHEVEQKLRGLGLVQPPYTYRVGADGRLKEARRTIEEVLAEQE